jgi:streptogramin lyase
MRISRVSAHRLKECQISAEKWNHFTTSALTEDWMRDETFREKWISPTSLLYHPRDGLVYVGLTALNGDIFYAFDPKSGAWESLRYPAHQDRYATKIHQSLQMDDDGRIYGAVATLSDVDIWPFAPGGQLFRFDPKTRTYEFLGIPIPHDYIQGIILDRRRGILYGDTFPGRKLFRYDIVSGKARELTMLGGVSTEHLALDSDGGVWHHYELAQWSGRCPLLRYDPDSDQVKSFNLDLPDLGATATRGSSQMDTALTTGDGTLYMGTASGALVRLDHRGPQVTYLGKPLPAPRLKGLLEGPDGILYGVGGAKYDTRLFTYDRTTGLFRDLGPIMDSQDGTRCWLAHDLCMVNDKTLIVAECDNHERASFVYKVTLD